MKKLMATSRGTLVEKTKKEDIEKAKVEGVCDIFTSTNHTLLRGPDIVKILGLIGGN